MWGQKGAWGLSLLLVVVCAGAPLALAAGHRSPRPVRVDPFRTAAMRKFLHSRRGNVTAAVENLRTGRTYVYRGGVREHTASIVKVDILETLLRHHQERHELLSPGEAETAAGMIEHSDNNDATALWNADGGAAGIAGYNRRAGLTQTIPGAGGYWGLTRTTPLDQIRLLRQLVRRHALLDGHNQRHELRLMSHVESDQRWGVSGGVASGTQIALKNGWLPESGGWQINSVGRIRGNGRHYLIAVLTSGNPSEGYGIGTIQGISAIVFRSLRERSAAHSSADRDATDTGGALAAARAAAREGARYHAAATGG